MSNPDRRISVKPKKVLLIDAHLETTPKLRAALEDTGYQVIITGFDDDVILTAEEHLPDIILLTEDINKPNFIQLCRQLRMKRFFYYVPIIILADTRDNDLDEVCFQAGADDIIYAPLTPEKVLRKIQVNLKRIYRYLQANPLTNLPGNAVVEKELRKSIDSGRIFAAAYIDLDSFKSYNDTYGWMAGDHVLQITADLILSVAEEIIGNEAFVGHLGGDDFVVIMPMKEAIKFSEEFIRRFDEIIPSVYSKADQERGYIIKRDRQGNLYCFPILSVSIAIATNAHRELVHTGQVAQIALELKNYLKPRLGSNYIIDRRRGKIEDSL
jgi:diguanylate cyclase (GGDEF)-like protein